MPYCINCGKEVAIVNTKCETCSSPAPKQDGLAIHSEAGMIGQPIPVRVIDLEMPFASMVFFMVKWAIAAIPALMILYVMIAIFGEASRILFGS